jgi:hypothetical protein
MNCDLLKLTKMLVSTTSGIYTNKITPQGKNNVITENCKSSQNTLVSYRNVNNFVMGLVTEASRSIDPVRGHPNLFYSIAFYAKFYRITSSSNSCKH